jgi:hypothetical protein
MEMETCPDNINQIKSGNVTYTIRLEQKQRQQLANSEHNTNQHPALDSSTSTVISGLGQKPFPRLNNL